MRGRTWVGCIGGMLCWLAGLSAPWTALASGDPVRELAGAKRLACAFSQGVTAGFSPQGRVTIRPPLDPNTPGLSIAIVDATKHRAVLEEDDKETSGVFMLTPAGLSVMVRYPDGGVAMVTVYPVYSGASDNFLMVMSQHGVATEPKLSQRYGMCRLGAEPSAAPAPSPEPKKSGHGHE